MRIGKHANNTKLAVLAGFVLCMPHAALAKAFVEVRGIYPMAADYRKNLLKDMSACCYGVETEDCLCSGNESNGENRGSRYIHLDNIRVAIVSNNDYTKLLCQPFSSGTESLDMGCTINENSPPQVALLFYAMDSGSRFRATIDGKVATVITKQIPLNATYSDYDANYFVYDASEIGQVITADVTGKEHARAFHAIATAVHVKSGAEDNTCPEAADEPWRQEVYITKFLWDLVDWASTSERYDKQNGIVDDVDLTIADITKALDAFPGGDDNGEKEEDGKDQPNARDMLKYLPDSARDIFKMNCLGDTP